MDVAHDDDADPVFSPRFGAGGDFDWGPHNRMSVAVTAPAMLIAAGTLLLILGVVLG